VVGHEIETERWFAHFTHALSQRCDMLRTVVRVEGESHFQLVDRLGGETREKDFVEALESVVKALEPTHAFLDREAGPLRFIEGGEARERGQTVERLISAHGGKQGDSLIIRRFAVQGNRVVVTKVRSVV
jgi:hypothetical protein